MGGAIVNGEQEKTIQALIEGRGEKPDKFIDPHTGYVVLHFISMQGAASFVITRQGKWRKLIKL